MATKRLRAKLTEVKHELTHKRHEPIPKQCNWPRRVVRAYFDYHGVPGNTAVLVSAGAQNQPAMGALELENQPL